MYIYKDTPTTSSNEPPKPAPFTFGATNPSTPSTGFTFGQSQQPAATASPFTFGSNSSTSTNQTPFTFGATTNGADITLTPSRNNPVSQQNTPSSAFVFGAGDAS